MVNSTFSFFVLGAYVHVGALRHLFVLLVALLYVLIVVLNASLILSRFDSSSVPAALRILLSLYFLLIQPLLTPVVYGLQTSRIRAAWKRLLGRRLRVGS
ncbi:uncharacterized protein V6R79_003816 [Siganus canaliculatus]